MTNITRFDTELNDAVAAAKRRVTPEGKLDLPLFVAALLNTTALKDVVPHLTRAFPLPDECQEANEKVPLDPAFKPTFNALRNAKTSRALSPKAALCAIAAHKDGSSFMRQRLNEEHFGAARAELGRLMKEAERGGAHAEDALRKLKPFGKMLTSEELPSYGTAEMDGILTGLVRILSKMRRQNAIIVGPSGTGKTAVVRELARRIRDRDPRIPKTLRDVEIFELSPAAFRAGTSLVGAFEQRIRTLLEVLEEHPQIVLFVDEIHSMFSGNPQGGAFAQANESFKAALSQGEMRCIGCTTPAEYRQHIADTPFERRFQVVRLEAPSSDVTVKILEARLPTFLEHYDPLTIPKHLLRRAVELTDDYMLQRFQPDKSIQLLDEACAACVTAQPPLSTLTEEVLIETLESSVGHGISRPGNVTKQKVLAVLKGERSASGDAEWNARQGILGQDQVLDPIAAAFVAGLGDWRERTKPRGVFLFAGPTGVGKTETALALAELLGAGRQALIRIDGNTLRQGTGGSSSRLLGVGAGYIGYVRGEGGLLSRVRDLPESVVLIDEFEKASPEVGQVLLQAIGEGRVEDADKQPLDFRRCFFIFTTNAGMVYPKGRKIGFEQQDPEAAPRFDSDALKDELHANGLGDEFLGRFTHTFHFKALGEATVRLVLAQQLQQVEQQADLRRMKLLWNDSLLDYLIQHWEARYGVRHLITLLRHRIVERISLAEAEGLLKGVREILLEGAERVTRDGKALLGSASHSRAGHQLIIRVE